MKARFCLYGGDGFFIQEYSVTNLEAVIFNAPTVDDDYIPSSPLEWHEWLSLEEAKTFRVYKEDPNRFLADYRTEQQTVGDYEGREILELLQNANDAAAEKEIASHVIIDLTQDGLVVGNTGLPFSTGGILSLRLAHLSPKASKRKQFVGNMGLGFRAILNWTSTPIILSGELILAYSLSFLKEKQKQALDQIPALKKIIGKVPISKKKLVVPLLTFPCIPADGCLQSVLNETKQEAIYKRCKELQDKGFDTIIGMPFENQSDFELALEQIQGLGHETLLFAPNLEKLEIHISSDVEILHIWTKDSNGKKVLINSETNDEIWEYKIFREEGEIPSQYLPDDAVNALNYEVLIALPTENNIKFGFLYSFFRTDVRFPYPILVHATLELQANRQSPRGTEANRFVLNRLASLMAETAEREVVPENKWHGCHIIAKQSSELAPLLSRLKFENVLMNEARQRKIIPTLSSHILSAENCRRIQVNDTSWLPPKFFPSVVEASPNSLISKLIESLGIKKIDHAEWVKSLNIIQFKNIEDRAFFLVGLIKNKLLNHEVPVGLLIDEEGYSIPEDCRIFLTSKDDKKFHLPDWLKIRFLNSELIDIIQSQLEIPRLRLLVSELSAWDVKEHSLDAIIGALVAETNKRIKADDKNKDKYSLELLKILWSLFPKEKENRPNFPKDAGLRIKSQAGTYTEVRKLYYGDGFGKYGHLMKALYGSFAPEKIIASPKEFGLPVADLQQQDLLFDFFSWLGVEKLPREIIVENLKESSFLNYVLSEIAYPARLEDIFRNSEKDWNKYKVSLMEVNTVDSLSEILANAESEAILTWLAIDDRVKHWNSWSTSHLTLTDYDKHQQKARKYREPVPCYISWQIHNSEWINTQEGKRKPADCFFGEKRFGKLLIGPAINPDHPLFRIFNVWPNIIDAFNRTGVLTRISHLELNQVYRLLLTLPEKDPEGMSARNLYTLFLQHEDSFFGFAQKLSQQFMMTGKLWGRHGNLSNYYPVNELKYIDAEDIPDTLSNKIKIVDLPKRLGAEKVKRFLGVSSVNKSKIEYFIENHRPVKQDKWLNGEFNAMKPDLYALRQAKSSQAPYLAAFKRLRIVVCDLIEGYLAYEGSHYPFKLGPWEWIYYKDTAYILYDLNNSSQNPQFSNPFFADAISAVIANIFRLESGSDFARLILCSRHDRRKLLEKILGEAELDWKALAEEFNDASENKQIMIDIQQENQEKAHDDETKGISDDVQTGEDKKDEQVDFPSDGKEVSDENSINKRTPLDVSEKNHSPSISKRIRLRVQRTPSQGGKPRSCSRLVTDGEFCEKKAMEFELIQDPQRYPLHVGRVTGYNGPKCDILSFASREDRQKFKHSMNPELIVRFIEVKGRSSDFSSILLKGNELDAARNYSDRYYLYRLYDTGNGEYELSILQDPLNDPDASTNLIEINLEAAQLTLKFDLQGGIKQGDHNDWDGNELPEYDN